MGIYPISPPCPICSGKVSKLLPAVIADEYVCDDCMGKLDVSQDLKKSLTMTDFRAYLAYYHQQQPLRDRFQIDEAFDFGYGSARVIFDYSRKLFCMSDKPDKTIFEAGQIRGFSVKEDRLPLIECATSGIKRYKSQVPDKAMALRTKINCFNINRQMTINKLRQEGVAAIETAELDGFSEAEPFEAFVVEIEVAHPYWRQVSFRVNGPRLNPLKPDLNDYLNQYRQSTEELERLVIALSVLAYSDKPIQPVSLGVIPVETVVSQSSLMGV